MEAEHVEAPEAPQAIEEEAPSNVLVLPAGVEREQEVGAQTLGVPGPPLNRRAPFFVGLTGALGVAVAYLLFRGMAHVSAAIVIIGLSLFLAIGLNPIVELLVRHGRSRIFAVILVTVGFLGVVAAFVLAAAPPIAHEIHSLVTNYPTYKHELATGKGWPGRLATKLHLTGYFNGSSKLHIPIGGLLGAGKFLLSVGVATTSVIALTTYFLIALPRVRSLWLALIPRSRRERATLLTDETLDRVGGFMLGNLFTSLISGVATYVWLAAFGLPYPLLLSLFVALFDMIPIIGSTLGGVVVTLVALTHGVPIAIATGAYFIAYRLLEDYLLNPKVMKHTVSVPPGLTIIATLIGGSLLGILGALFAIPVAATIQLLVEEIVIPGQDKR